MSTSSRVCGGSSAIRNHLPPVALTHTLRDRPQSLLGVDYIDIREIVGEESGHGPCLASGNDKGDENLCAAYHGGGEFVGQSIGVGVMRIKVAAVKQTGMAIRWRIRGGFLRCGG